MKPMRKAIFLPILFLFIFSAYSYGAEPTIYQWVDKNGTLNFSDDLEKVPPAYRNQIKIKSSGKTPQIEPPAPPAAPTAAPQEAEKVDNYGSDENYWRDRAAPLEKQKDEASGNYELKNNEIKEESDKLIQRKFGSRQQYKSTILELDRLNQEKGAYESQLKEAKQMLEKISKEAEESEADPNWLKPTPKPAQRTSSNAADIEKDILGRDETWWREQLSPLRQRLKDAVGNYDKAYKDYSATLEELSPSRFAALSPTQYKMHGQKLDELNNEMTKFQGQIDEVKQTLNKLLKDAEETKADPDWLKE
jgi:uncharacterized coiled-coil DUF342 family protein